MLCNVERSRGISYCRKTPVSKPIKNSERFIEFARNDKKRCRNLFRVIRRLMTSRFRFGFLALTWLVTSSDTFAVTTPARPEHTNRLAQEKSPYLLQHAHNPVDWYPWGEEAFAKARRENKPI